MMGKAISRTTRKESVKQPISRMTGVSPCTLSEWIVQTRTNLQNPIFQTTMPFQFMKLTKLLFPQLLTKQNLDPLMYLEDRSLPTMDGHCTILARMVKPGDSIKG